MLFASTADDLGPYGAKSMSEAPYNPVAPALANAIRDAIGVRPHELPMTRDRIWRLAQQPDALRSAERLPADRRIAPKRCSRSRASNSSGCG